MRPKIRTLPIDYQTALENNLWGYFWASMASEQGVRTAGALSLPKSDEATALQFAASFHRFRSPMPVAAQMWADETASLAIEAFKATLPLLVRARNTHPTGPTLWRHVDDAVFAAEHLGRAAAKAQRTLTVLVSKQGGGR